MLWEEWIGSGRGGGLLSSSRQAHEPQPSHWCLSVAQTPLCLPGFLPLLLWVASFLPDTLGDLHQQGCDSHTFIGNKASQKAMLCDPSWSPQVSHLLIWSSALPKLAQVSHVRLRLTPPGSEGLRCTKQFTLSSFFPPPPASPGQRSFMSGKMQ